MNDLCKSGNDGFQIETWEPRLSQEGDGSSLNAERVSKTYSYIAGGFVDTISKFILCTMDKYVEEVLDAMKDQFIGCVLALVARLLINTISNILQIIN